MAVKDVNNVRYLVYPCNVLGYVRLCLLGAATTVWLTGQADSTIVKLGFVTLTVASSLLDTLDGPLARRFAHQTEFGMWLDQVTDLLTSTVVWLASGFFLAVPILILEWVTGLIALRRATRCVGHAKRDMSRSRGWFPRRYFANCQRNAFSAVANVSHFVFPVALFLGPDFRWIALLAAPGLVAFELATVFILVYSLRQADATGRSRVWRASTHER